jgi:hypothetical protein
MLCIEPLRCWQIKTGSPSFKMKGWLSFLESRYCKDYACFSPLFKMASIKTLKLVFILLDGNLMEMDQGVCGETKAIRVVYFARHRKAFDPTGTH